MSQHVATLEGEACVHLRGREIPRFLQGQLTCDLRALAPAHAIAGAMCNVKGRVISDLWVIPVSNEHCILRLRRSLAKDFAENLERYARFSRITVEAQEESGAILGIYGPGLIGGPSLPGAIGAIERSGSLLYLRSGERQVEVIATAPAETLRAGHYALEKEDSERFTPQALNYDLTGRVAFDKGCYTGQEVVARLHYRGQSKRRLGIYSVSGPTPARGTALLDEDGREVGECLRSEIDGEGRTLLAAMVKTDLGEALPRDADGQPLTPLPQT